jgi:hypothetical protein
MLADVGLGVPMERRRGDLEPRRQLLEWFPLEQLRVNLIAVWMNTDTSISGHRNSF